MNTTAVEESKSVDSAGMPLKSDKGHQEVVEFLEKFVRELREWDEKIGFERINIYDFPRPDDVDMAFLEFLDDRVRSLSQLYDECEISDLSLDISPSYGMGGIGLLYISDPEFLDKHAIAPFRFLVSEIQDSCEKHLDFLNNDLAPIARDAPTYPGDSVFDRLQWYAQPWAKEVCVDDEFNLAVIQGLIDLNEYSAIESLDEAILAVNFAISTGSLVLKGDEQERIGRLLKAGRVLLRFKPEYLDQAIRNGDIAPTPHERARFARTAFRNDEPGNRESCAKSKNHRQSRGSSANPKRGRPGVRCMTPSQDHQLAKDWHEHAKDYKDFQEFIEVPPMEVNIPKAIRTRDDMRKSLDRDRKKQSRKK